MRTFLFQEGDDPLDKQRYVSTLNERSHQYKAQEHVHAGNMMRYSFKYRNR
jgi:hypothetical protein